MSTSELWMQDYRVLLVDDNELNREMEAAMLEPYGCQVVPAESGAEAIQLARESAFDMILLDYLMPEMDGLETAEHLSTLYAGQEEKPVLVALTADTSGEVAEAFRQRGCQDLLGKPMDEEKLRRILERWAPLEPGEGPAPCGGMTEDEVESLQIGGIDLNATDIRHHKTKEQYVDLLLLFYEDGVRQLETWQSVPPECVEGYRIWVHALKSASANIGALALSEQAKAQEQAAKDGDIHQIEEEFPRLMETYRRLLMNIATRVHEQLQPMADHITKPALDREELRTTLWEALDLLERFRAHDCTQIILELLQHQLPEEVRVLLHEARDKLHMYEDDEAEGVLRTAIDAVSGD